MNEIINKDIKVFRDYEFVVAEDDCWGRWNTNMVGRLLKDFNLNIFNKMRNS